MAVPKKVAPKVTHAVADAIRAGVLKTVALNSVKLWADNPRKNEKASKKVADILKKHGQVSPIVVNTVDNVIYKGNTTWKAMKSLGRKDILVLFVKFPSVASAKAYGIADNMASEFAEWDDAVLSTIMRSEDLTTLSGGDSGELKLLTGLDDKRIKSLLLSSDLPDELPDVDIKGLTQGKSDFIVLQFTNKSEVALFKNNLGLPDDYARVIPVEVLLEKLEWKTPPSKTPTTAPHRKCVRPVNK